MLPATQSLDSSKEDEAVPAVKYRQIKLRARSPVLSCSAKGKLRLGIEEGTDKLYLYEVDRDNKNNDQVIDRFECYPVDMIETTEDMKTLIIAGYNANVRITLLQNNNRYMETYIIGTQYASCYNHAFYNDDADAQEPFYPQGHADFDKLSGFFTVIGAGGTGFPAAATPAA